MKPFLAKYATTKILNAITGYLVEKDVQCNISTPEHRVRMLRLVDSNTEIVLDGLSIGITRYSGKSSTRKSYPYSKVLDKEYIDDEPHFKVNTIILEDILSSAINN